MIVSVYVNAISLSIGIISIFIGIICLSTEVKSPAIRGISISMRRRCVYAGEEFVSETYENGSEERGIAS
jgi:hypothetical protein